MPRANQLSAKEWFNLARLAETAGRLHPELLAFRVVAVHAHTLGAIRKMTTDWELKKLLKHGEQEEERRKAEQLAAIDNDVRGQQGSGADSEPVPAPRAEENDRTPDDDDRPEIKVFP